MSQNSTPSVNTKVEKTQSPEDGEKKVTQTQIDTEEDKEGIHQVSETEIGENKSQNNTENVTEEPFTQTQIDTEDAKEATHQVSEIEFEQNKFQNNAENLTEESFTQTQIDTKDAKEATHQVSETEIGENKSQNNPENVTEESFTQTQIDAEDAKRSTHQVSETEIQKNEENSSPNNLEKMTGEATGNKEESTKDDEENVINIDRNLEEAFAQTQIDTEASQREIEKDDATKEELAKDDQQNIANIKEEIEDEKQTAEDEPKLVLIEQESNELEIEELILKAPEEPIKPEPEKRADAPIPPDTPLGEPEIIPKIEKVLPEETQEKRVPQHITHDGQEMDSTILNLLENRLKEIGITNYNMKMSPGCKPGDNMLGIVAKVQINGTDSKGSDTELNWIVKIAPPIQALRKIIKVDILYQNEVLIYESVFPIYKELEKERSIRNGFNSYPEYLFSNLDHLKETVVMTDMTSLGFVARNKKEPLELEHVKLVMKTYGKLHALSYAFQDKMPSLFEQFSTNFQRNIQNAIDVFELKKTQQGIMEDALATLDPIRNNLAYKKFSKFVDNFMAIYFEASRHSNKHSVIGHGDSWINNMLFKYENSSSSTPSAVCLLDFQTVNYASPVCDISYFLFTCTDKDFRDQHYDNVVKLYYYNLCSHLTDLGCDPEKFLPFHILEAELKKYSVVGLYLSILALMAMIRDGDEVGDWQGGDADENAKAILAKSRNQDIYNERVRDVILDFSQKGYLDFLFSKK
ncbi:hypothetical protein MML48_2g00006943 [Holotrichia oblita]|uniref:Uncharacterized protein n=1 Tax=Holotrichia oblita TaxID=644536 RepID=A0ACB9TJ60_HOLOL|nr:hypothetical protein MML48_2g00006943 [Holotrichia oblita]